MQGSASSISPDSTLYILCRRGSLRYYNSRSIISQIPHSFVHVYGRVSFRTNIVLRPSKIGADAGQSQVIYFMWWPYFISQTKRHMANPFPLKLHNGIILLKNGLETPSNSHGLGSPCMLIQEFEYYTLYIVISYSNSFSYTAHDSQSFACLWFGLCWAKMDSSTVSTRIVQCNVYVHDDD